MQKLLISEENSKAKIIEEQYNKGKLSLKTAIMPCFVFNNDKLAAHQLMVIELDIYIPVTISVEIKSKFTSL